MFTMIEPLIKELLEAGVHFGHQTHRWNPKMRRFIFGEKNGIYIVDLEMTASHLAAAREFLRSVAAQGGSILFVGTKRQAQPILTEEAIRCEQFYVTFRWLGGLLTNFQTIRKSIDLLKKLRAWRDDGTLSRLTKKEAAGKEKELAKLERSLGGIIEMGRLPKAMVVVDAKREETAVKEATRLGIPVVALVDTNSDPDPIAYCIPGNDDAIRSIKLVISLLADSVLEGHQTYLAGLPQETVSVVEEEPPPPPPPVELPPVAAALPGEAELPVIPVVDEVEAIVSPAALKVEVEPLLPKKKRLPKPKSSPKEKEDAPPIG